MSEKKLLEHLDKAEIEAFLKDLHKDDGPSHYDKDWLKQENERRSAQGLPPLHERKRKALDRERLRTLKQMVPPGEYINPDYELVEACPETRQPERERARRALNVLFPSGIPDAPTLSNKRLEKKVNTWLATKGLPSINERTIRRAAGRR